MAENRALRPARAPDARDPSTRKTVPGICFFLLRFHRRAGAARRRTDHDRPENRRRAQAPSSTPARPCRLRTSLWRKPCGRFPAAGIGWPGPNRWPSSNGCSASRTSVSRMTGRSGVPCKRTRTPRRRGGISRCRQRRRSAISAIRRTNPTALSSSHGSRPPHRETRPAGAAKGSTFGTLGETAGCGRRTSGVGRFYIGNRSEYVKNKMRILVFFALFSPRFQRVGPAARRTGGSHAPFLVAQSLP